MVLPQGRHDFSEDLIIGKVFGPDGAGGTAAHAASTPSADGLIHHGYTFCLTEAYRSVEADGQTGLATCTEFFPHLGNFCFSFYGSARDKAGEDLTCGRLSLDDGFGNVLGARSTADDVYTLGRGGHRIEDLMEFLKIA